MNAALCSFFGELVWNTLNKEVKYFVVEFTSILKISKPSIFVSSETQSPELFHSVPVAVIFFA